MVTSLKLQKLLCVRKYHCKVLQNVCNLVDENHIPEGYLCDGVSNINTGKCFFLKTFS